MTRDQTTQEEQAQRENSERQRLMDDMATSLATILLDAFYDLDSAKNCSIDLSKLVEPQEKIFTNEINKAISTADREASSLKQEREALQEQLDSLRRQIVDKDNNLKQDTELLKKVISTKKSIAEIDIDIKYHNHLNNHYHTYQETLSKLAQETESDINKWGTISQTLYNNIYHVVGWVMDICDKGVAYSQNSLLGFNNIVEQSKGQLQETRSKKPELTDEQSIAKQLSTNERQLEMGQDSITASYNNLYNSYTQAINDILSGKFTQEKLQKLEKTESTKIANIDRNLETYLITLADGGKLISEQEAVKINNKLKTISWSQQIKAYSQMEEQGKVLVEWRTRDTLIQPTQRNQVMSKAFCEEISNILTKQTTVDTKYMCPPQVAELKPEDDSLLAMLAADITTSTAGSATQGITIEAPTTTSNIGSAGNSTGSAGNSTGSTPTTTEIPMPKEESQSHNKESEKLVVTQVPSGTLSSYGIPLAVILVIIVTAAVSLNKKLRDSVFGMFGKTKDTECAIAEATDAVMLNPQVIVSTPNTTPPSQTPHAPTPIATSAPTATVEAGTQATQADETEEAETEDVFNIEVEGMEELANVFGPHMATYTDNNNEPSSQLIHTSVQTEGMHQMQDAHLKGIVTR